MLSGIDVQSEIEQQQKVFILGELNIDLIMTGEDVTPEWNREKIVDSFQMVMGSSSAITACGLASLGAEVYFVGVVGDDDFGRFILQELEKSGVHTQYITLDPTLRTGVTLSLSTSKDRALLTYMGSIPCLNPSLLPAALLLEATHIHFGSYYLQQQMQPHWIELFRQAQEAGISTSFDTGWDPEQLWHRADIEQLLAYTSLFIPSEDEIMQILNITLIEQASEHLPHSRNNVIIKRGSKGATWIEADSQSHSIPAFNVNVIDTTGAGDSFNAGLILSFLAGKQLAEMLRFANASGALATQRIGGAGQMPTLQEVEAFLATR